ncbi:signal peptide peptidase-like 2A [Triplophysa rosa]|uniref:Signal peptide peptidase-like 2A n=1 Tax=Triplophysa rosa TaxID=992332 RepID=A0A9W7TPJ1_TRIRA|nr:signal peptide peptidase-like 2A [Triplophysa rosa]KAI7802855.1 signal peptide peptidase-like 2A precursor [Triplophysa rosa]
MTRYLFIVLPLMLCCCQVDGQEAILQVSNGSTVREYCLVFNSSWSNISQDPSAAKPYPLMNLTSSLLCDAGVHSSGSLQGRAVVVMRGVCSFSQKAQIAQSLGASVLLIASTDNLVTPSANDSEYSKVKIPLALVRYRDVLDALQVFPQGMEVKLYAPPAPQFDASVIILLLIAVFTVALGGFWSGAAERVKQTAGSSANDGLADGSEITLYSPLKVLLFVAMMCVMLVLMYFFYTWMVYGIIVIFCLASATALFNCLDSLMTAMGFGTLSLSCSGKTVCVRSLLLAAVCITLAVVWGVYRNDDRWIWILQDLLGVAFCLNFLKTITLSNFKICVILLSLLLVYDVFFVFITPFLTPNGESIMVQVALGPGGGRSGGKTVEIPADPSSSYEKLPVVMRIPQFFALAHNLCMTQFSILGYGDIIIPGLLVAYCHRFDVWMGNSRRIYFISCALAYCVGLVVTFAVMLVSKMGQPALLYLVPCTLLTSSILACVRKEFQQFWAGTIYQVLDESRKPLLSDGDVEYAGGEGTQQKGIC